MREQFISDCMSSAGTAGTTLAARVCCAAVIKQHVCVSRLVENTENLNDSIGGSLKGTSSVHSLDLNNQFVVKRLIRGLGCMHLHFFPMPITIAPISQP